MTRQSIDTAVRPSGAEATRAAARRKLDFRRPSMVSTKPTVPVDAASERPVPVPTKIRSRETLASAPAAPRPSRRRRVLASTASMSVSSASDPEASRKPSLVSISPGISSGYSTESTSSLDGIADSPASAAFAFERAHACHSVAHGGVLLPDMIDCSRLPPVDALAQMNLAVRQALGRGSFGTVWTAVSTSPVCKPASLFAEDAVSPDADIHSPHRSIACVVKMVEKRPASARHGSMSNLRHRHQVLREASLGMTQHPSLLACHGIVETSKNYCLLLEHAAHGDLFHAISSNYFNGLDFGRRTRDVLVQVAAGLDYMHTRLGLIHGDVKPENILLTAAGAKLCDFGSVLPVFASSTRLTGSAPYTAPELVAWYHAQHAEPVKTPFEALPVYDVWALGTTSMTMLFRGHPWRTARVNDPDFQRFYKLVIMERIDLTRVCPEQSPWCYVSRSLLTLLQASQAIRPDQRCSMGELRLMLERVWAVAAQRYEDGLTGEDEDPYDTTDMGVLAEKAVLRELQAAAAQNESFTPTTVTATATDYDEDGVLYADAASDGPELADAATELTRTPSSLPDLLRNADGVSLHFVDDDEIVEAPCVANHEPEYEYEVQVVSPAPRVAHDTLARLSATAAALPARAPALPSSPLSSAASSAAASPQTTAAAATALTLRPPRARSPTRRRRQTTDSRRYSLPVAPDTTVILGAPTGLERCPSNPIVPAAAAPSAARVSII